tara:strand:+ start:8495 stop:8752 length:258 start_codon:yes stop_codon:yes gene_type:complete
MTLHHIAGSEVGEQRPLAYLSQIKRRRRRTSIPQLVRNHPALMLHLAMVPLGVCVGLVDALVIGKPCAIVLAVASLVAWRFWPTR